MATIIDMCTELIYNLGFYDHSEHVRILGMFLEMALIFAVLATPFVVAFGIVKFITRLGRYEN